MSNQLEVRWKRGFAEFVVIFLGVSLSLLADEWRDDRREAAEREAVFDQLAEDLRDDLLEHRFVRSRAVRHGEASQWILDRWDGAEPDPDSVASVFGTFSCPMIFEYRSPAYAGLQSASGLPLISRTDLGRELIGYFEIQQVEAENFAESLEASLARLVETLYPIVRFEPCLVGQGQVDAPLLVSWGTMTSDPELRNRLAEVVSRAGLTTEWVDRAVTKAEALMEEMDASETPPGRDDSS
jgi:hypothetical protein